MEEENKSVPFIEKALSFARDKGFYIILALCVLAIGISGYVLFFSTPSTQKPISLEEITIPAITTRPAEITTPITTLPPTTIPSTSPQTTLPSEIEVGGKVDVPQIPPKDKDAETVNPIKPKTFVLPHEGEVSRPFSGSELVKDPTMGDWRTHKGADINCNYGDEIKVITDGEVSGVFTDPMMGNCIAVTHSDGLVTTYCGLDVNKTMRVGQKLKSGDAVGIAGNTVLAESGQACHVHIEATQDGAYIDPLGLIK